MKTLLSWVFGKGYFLHPTWHLTDASLERKSMFPHSGKDRRVVGLHTGRRSMFPKSLVSFISEEP